MKRNIRNILCSLVLILSFSCNFSSGKKEEPINTGLEYKQDLSSQEYFDKAIELQRENGFFLSTSKDTQIYVESARLIEKAILLDSSRVDFYINVSQIYFKLDYQEEAIQALEKLLVVDSSYVEAITALGFMLEKFGYQEEANRRYKESLKIYNLRLNKTYNDYINRTFLVMLLYGNNAIVQELEQIKEKFPKEDVAFFEHRFENFNRKEFIKNSLK